jgi:hypothetical protein
MAEIRSPTAKEPSSSTSGTRSKRLRDLVSGGQWVGNDKIALIYWSPENGGRWVMWEDPDPLKEAGITTGS